MSTTLLDFAPFIPSDETLGQSSLPDKALELNKESAKLTGQLSPLTLATLEQYMRVINSYYSNLIEGNPTHPHEIRAAQHGDYSCDSAKRDLQKESLGHMAVQRWVSEQNPDLDTIFSPEFIQTLHEKFYRQIPESLWIIKDAKGNEVDKLMPGKWRIRKVDVDQHVAPEAEFIPDLAHVLCWL